MMLSVTERMKLLLINKQRVHLCLKQRDLQLTAVSCSLRDRRTYLSCGFTVQEIQTDSIPALVAADVKDQILPPNTHTHSPILLFSEPLSPIISDSDGIWSVVLFPEGSSVFSAFCLLQLINSSDQ